MKVRLDAAAGEVDQQGRGKHLRSGDDVPGDDPSGAEHRQQNGQQRDSGAAENGDPDVDVQHLLFPRPGVGGEPERGGDAGDPLDDEEHGEGAIDAHVAPVPLLGVELLGAVGD